MFGQQVTIYSPCSAGGSSRLSPSVLSQIPLSKASEDAEAAALAEAEASVPLSASRLPSCCFCSFLNTHQTLNCATFAHDATKLVGA